MGWDEVAETISITKEKSPFSYYKYVLVNYLILVFVVNTFYDAVFPSKLTNNKILDFIIYFIIVYFLEYISRFFNFPKTGLSKKDLENISIQVFPIKIGVLCLLVPIFGLLPRLLNIDTVPYFNFDKWFAGFWLLVLQTYINDLLLKEMQSNYQIK